MHLGIQWFGTIDAIDPARLAREVEGQGFTSLFMPEHTHLPVQSSPRARPLPDFYRATLDPFVALGFAAAATSTLRLGTAVCLLAQRDALITAKQVATLDALSGGRFDFGIGFGWNRPEAEHHGVDWRRRFSLVREQVAAMRVLWSDDVASFAGEFVRFAPSYSWPKPAQRPGPRVFVGGSGPTTMRHAAEWASVWFPFVGPDDVALERGIPVFRDLVERAGRDPGAVPVHVATAPPDPAILERLAAQGVEQTLLELRPADADSSLRRLEELALVARQFRG